MPLIPLQKLPSNLATHANKRVFRLSRRWQRKVVGPYELGSVLGKGSYGCVRSGIVSQKGASVAVKQAHGTDKARDSLHNEVALQLECHDHPNIPTLFDIMRDSKGRTFSVMEFATGGDLFTRICDHGALTVESAMVVMRQLVSAVEYMHSKGIAHCDIKPENILLTGDGSHVLLCDFGLAVRCGPNHPQFLTKPRGTLRCMAPEMVTQVEAGGVQFDPRAADVFALGNVLFFMLTARFPFLGSSMEDTMLNIAMNLPTSSLPEDLPDDCRDLVAQLLQHDVARRPSVQSVASHAALAHALALERSHSF